MSESPTSAFDGAASIRKFLTLVRALTELEPALTELGSVRQAITEGKARLEQVRNEENSLVRRIDEHRLAEAAKEAALKALDQKISVRQGQLDEIDQRLAAIRSKIA